METEEDFYFLNFLSEVVTVESILVVSIAFVVFNGAIYLHDHLKERRFQRELGKRFEAYVPDKDDRFNHDQDT